LPTLNVTEETFMGFSDESDIGLDEIDYVSAWILRLAIGMIVVGAVFATLDWYHLLPSLPAAATVAGLS
jgi:hypothetical protein